MSNFRGVKQPQASYKVRIDANMGDSNTSCQQSTDQLLKLITTTVTAGGAGVIIATLILLVLLLARVYKTVLQRLILYSVLAVLVQHLCNFANILVFATKLQDSVACKWLGFITNWSGWSEYLVFSVIILYLLCVVCVQLKGVALKPLPRYRISLEIFVILLCTLFPGFVLWVPMCNKNIKYGLDNGYCLFKATVKHEKPYFDWYFFFFNFMIYEIIALLCVIIAICLLVIYCMLPSQLKQSVLMKKLFRILAILLTAIMVNSVLLNIMLGSYIANRYWMFTTIFEVLDDFIFLGAFLLVFYSSKASWKKLKKMVTKRKPPPQQSVGSKYGTLWSVTYWTRSAPFTGAFSSGHSTE